MRAEAARHVCAGHLRPKQAEANSGARPSGKKPLHYSLHDGKLYFASEIKSILAVAPELAEINSQGLLEYLYYGYVPDPITAFVRIHKLPPGHLLEFAGGEVRVREYWDFPEYRYAVLKSEEECLEELEYRLSEATKIRLLSDVPWGRFSAVGQLLDRRCVDGARLLRSRQDFFHRLQAG